jgi:flagellar motor switch protein FliN/FliY
MATTGPGAGEPGGAAGQGGGADVVARVAQFAELTGSAAEPGAGGLEGLQDVSVTVAAELGRVSLTIGEVLKLGVGSVLELHRSITEPVDLMVQGVRLARGEVVVVDDRFAIRIKEIAEPKKRAER